MQRPDTQASRRAWGWLVALQNGATTPWQEWAGDAEAGDCGLRFFPAAQQLEALRRVNLAAAGRPVSSGVATALLTEGITDRNRGDLPLVGEDPVDFGPRPVDPSLLPAADLLPVVAGPLARRVAAVPERAPRRPLPLVRGWRTTGDPLLAAHVAAAQVRRGRGRPGARTLVLGADLVTMAVHAWVDHAVSGGRLSLLPWLGERVTATRLPRALDLAAEARRSSEQVGARHTVIALDPGALRGVPAPPRVDPTAVEVARWVGRPLGLLVEPERRRGLLLDVLLPRATRDTGPLTLPEPWQTRLAAYAETQRSLLSEAGYPVLGSLDALLPAPAARPTALPTDEDVLTRAIEVLLEPVIIGTTIGTDLEGVRR